MDALDIFLISVPVGLLITWRLLTGSTRQHRDELRAADSTRGGDVHARARNVGLANSRFESKRLRICNQPCRAALKLRDQVFLANDAPPLPLPDCDRTSGCHCEYSTHDDRRGNHDRRYPAEDIVPSDDFLLPDSAVLTQDRREDNDRRRRKAARPVSQT
ncbi:MAG: hypothetical protein HKN56_08740 [Gammaproteobacteria bacterium]|nr:hypothetical protein [Gammaproteobacteria bacterium]